jgi:aryl-alcohol dehydrogenase-like predicted oxidoreductase
MEYRHIGESALTISVIGLGCDNLGERLSSLETHSLVHTALDLGITFFDTADVYGNPSGTSEELLAAALGRHREEVILATKFGKQMSNAPVSSHRASQSYIRRAVDASLRRLRTDHIDLYQLHEPDPDTPLEETLEALDSLVTAGKIRYIGCSNFTVSELKNAKDVACATGSTRFISIQNEYSLIDRTAEESELPYCVQTGIGFLAYSPMASGLLTGKYARHRPPSPGTRLADPWYKKRLSSQSYDRLEAIMRYANQRSQSVISVALGIAMATPGISSLIVGATTPRQLQENVASASWQPTGYDLNELEAIAPSGTGV